MRSKDPRLGVGRFVLEIFVNAAKGLCIIPGERGGLCISEKGCDPLFIGNATLLRLTLLGETAFLGCLFLGKANFLCTTLLDLANSVCGFRVLGIYLDDSLEALDLFVSRLETIDARHIHASTQFDIVGESLLDALIGKL